MARDCIHRGALTLSDKYASRSIGARLLFRELLNAADNFGLFKATHTWLRSQCFPGGGVTDDDLDRWIAELMDSDLLRLYEVEGVPFGMLPQYRQHIRSLPRFPLPPPPLMDSHLRASLEVADKLRWNRAGALIKGESYQASPNHAQRLSGIPAEVIHTQGPNPEVIHNPTNPGYQQEINNPPELPANVLPINQSLNLGNATQLHSNGTALAPQLQSNCVMNKGLMGYGVSNSKAFKSIVGQLPDVTIEPPIETQTPEPTPPEVPPLEPARGLTPKERERRERNAAAVRLLEFLNEKTGRRYQAVPANVRLIVARLAEGATETQVRQVIANRCMAWANDPTMTDYLRPATLFNAQKFAQYFGGLGAKRVNTTTEGENP